MQWIWLKISGDNFDRKMSMQASLFLRKLRLEPCMQHTKKRFWHRYIHSSMNFSQFLLRTHIAENVQKIFTKFSCKRLLLLLFSSFIFFMQWVSYKTMNEDKLLQELQSFTKYLRLTLVSMWNSALQAKFNLHFWRVFS